MNEITARLKNELGAVIDEILGPEFNVPDAKEMGLYRGMEQDEADGSSRSFNDRLNDKPHQKDALGEYLMRNTVDEKAPSFQWSLTGDSDIRFKKVFFERGSTLCPLLGKIANEYSDAKSTNNPHKIERVLTNNLFALTSLVNLVKEVTPVEGQFVTSYFGFFPFKEKPDAPVNDENAGRFNKQLWQTEADGYARIKKGVAESDIVVTTCSNFSFLAGPLVGRRANAIAKHAMYIGKQPNHEFLILMDFQKIIPFTEPPMEMSKPGENCYCILPQPRHVAVEMEAATMDGWHRKWVDGRVKKETTDFSKGVFNNKFVGLRYLPTAVSSPDFSKPWRDLATGTRIIVSLPDKREKKGKEYIPNRQESYEWLRNELEKCEEKIGQRLQFDISDWSVADQYGVADIEVTD